MGHNTFVGEGELINPLTEAHPPIAVSVRRIIGFMKGIIIMMNESGKCEKHIKGINCSVKNCAYHDGECYCTANAIAVAPTGTDKSFCATYKPCQDNSCR